MQEVDPNTQLATTVMSSFLMPYLQQGAEKLGKIAADNTLDVAKKIWERIQQRFSASDEKSALTFFKNHPDMAQEMILKLLTKSIENDMVFANELRDLINFQQHSSEKNSTQIIQGKITGIVDIRNANLSNSRNLRITGMTLNQGKPED
jgi:hypothetical protein